MCHRFPYLRLLLRLVFISTFLLIIIGSSVFARTVHDELRVVTLNVYGAPDSQWEIRESMIIEEMASLQPDIICFQEAVETPTLGGQDNRIKILLEKLSRNTGIHYHYHYAFAHPSWGVFNEGVVIASPHIVMSAESLMLPAGLFSRNILGVRLLTPMGIIDTYCTHLSHGEQQEQVRVDQAQAIKEFIANRSQDSEVTAVVLCGDFNATPFSPPITTIKTLDASGISFRDSWAEIWPQDPGFTVVPDNPHARIDYIFFREGDGVAVVQSERVFMQPNAQGIYPSDHIGVFSILKTAPEKFNIPIEAPRPGESISGIYPVSWQMDGLTGPFVSYIFMSSDGGRSWQFLWEDKNDDRTFQWNTSSTPDGARYSLTVAAIGTDSFGFGQLMEPFTVNNPGNAPPEVELISPLGGENLRNTVDIQWLAVDAEDDPLTISIDISFNDGLIWKPIFVEVPNTGAISWNTLETGNSTTYQMRMRCSDGEHESIVVTNVFSIANEFSDYSEGSVTQTAGMSSAIVKAYVVDSGQLKPHHYRITFNESRFQYKVYDVFDLTENKFVVQNASEINSITHGPIFDGLRLVVKDFDPPEIDYVNSGWTMGQSTLDVTIYTPSIDMGTETLEGVPYPADYVITFSDQVIDTSAAEFGLPSIPMKFIVHNITEDEITELLFIDMNNDQTISLGDEVYLLLRDEHGNPILSWALSFTGSQSALLPQGGDKFLIKTLKPLTQNDVFEINHPSSVKTNRGSGSPRKIQLFDNFPNPFNGSTTIMFDLSNDAVVELKISNNLGQIIKTLSTGPQKAGRHQFVWRGRDQNGSAVSTGLYLMTLTVGHSIKTRKLLYLK